MEIEIPIFNSRAIVYFGSTEDFRKEIIKLYNDASLFDGLSWDDNIIGKAGYFSNGVNFLWMLDKPKDDLGVFNHEVFHLANAILVSRDIPVNEFTEEVTAYLIEYLTKEIFKKIEEKD